MLLYIENTLKIRQRTFFNSFPNKPWFIHVSRTSLLKTMREKEKLLVTSNFFFSHRVFKRLVLQTRKNRSLFGQRLKNIDIVQKKGRKCWLPVFSSVSTVFSKTCLLRIMTNKIVISKK